MGPNTAWHVAAALVIGLGVLVAFFAVLIFSGVL